MVLFKRSPYAIASTPDGELGCYGAVLLRPMTLRVGGWRENEELIVGTVIPGHVVAEWRLPNKLAMRENRMVRFFLSPEEAAEAGVHRAAEARANPMQASISAEDDRRQAKIDQLARARAIKAQKAFAGAE